MAFQTSSGKQTALAEINIIPLVDIMLVLLIIFMVTAPFMQSSVDVDLPKVSTATANEAAKNKVLTIDATGHIFVQEDKETVYDLDTLLPKLTGMFADVEGDEEKIIFIRADQGVPYGTVVKVMALCKEAGIARIGMITQPEDES